MNANSATFVLTAQQLCDELCGELVGDGSVEITGVNTVDNSTASEVCFVSDKKHVSGLADSLAGAVIIGEKVDGYSQVQLVVEDVTKTLIVALGLFAPKLIVDAGIHPTAVVEDDAVIGENVNIGPNVHIDHGVKIGTGCVIGANCSVGQNSVIGQDTRLYSNVSVYHGCQIGSNCVIQSNTTIGSVGFGYSFIDGQHKLIPHNGGVLIEDCVEIGSCTCIDRAKFGNTIIGAGTKIDNSVHIAHNCIIGRCCLLAGQVAIAGSVTLGDGVVFGGRSGSSDNLTIGSGTIVGGCSAVFKNLPAGQKVWGTPAQDAMAEMKQISLLKKLPKINKQLRELVAKVKELEASKND
jgi:UDP-3-O-[3-hydroxymyristoyl] glucosamine N-acyltransferase